MPRLAVEAAASFGWDRYADASVSIDNFGASAPGDEVLAEFGFTPEHVADRAGGAARPPTRRRGHAELSPTARHRARAPPTRRQPSPEEDP